MVFFKKGPIFTVDGLHIATLARDVYYGEHIMPDQFDWIKESPNPQLGDEIPDELANILFGPPRD